MQSRCIRVLTIGGETPLHKWLTLLQQANLAGSWATLLKSLFTCRICQPAKPSRRFTIPFTMWLKPPPLSLAEMRCTTARESDSIMIYWKSNSLASKTPASIANASFLSYYILALMVQYPYLEFLDILYSLLELSNYF